MSLIWKLLAGLLAIGALIVAFYFFGLRTKNRLALTGIRRINRVMFNPRQMKTAGTPGAYASIVHHVGRVSGTGYQTPICTRERGDDLVVVLPYDTQADWVKNVLAAGAARIDHEGMTSTVSNPRLVAVDDVIDVISKSDQRSNAMVGNVRAMLLRKDTTS